MTGLVPPAPRPGAAPHPLAIAGAALLFLALCALYWPFAADDAFIVGRYARNAAAGNGLVYNLGEQVSALTSPLHALLETGLALLGLAPVESYRLLAPLLVLAGWLAVLRETGLRGSAFVIFTAASLLSPFLVLWTVGGLETPILACFAALFAARLATISRVGTSRPRDLLWLGVLAGLMFLTRYDSVLVTAPILLAVLTVEYRRPALWLGAALCLALAGGWLAFAAWYYGDIFPTSYYLKFAIGGRPGIDSLSALLNFLLLSGLWLIALRLRPAPISAKPLLARAILRGAAFSLALFMVYASRSAGQHMMFGYRLFVPYLMAASLVLALALPEARRGLAAAVLAAQAGMIAVVGFLGINPAPLTRIPGLHRAYAEYEFITPATYGDFLQMLRDDAREITAHWQAQAREDQPRIYLRTGGTGYWLPEFYVYESLVSYRHDCGVPMAAMVDAAHYMQQLGFSQAGTVVEDRGRARDDVADDAALLFATQMVWMGRYTTGYLYGPDPIPLDLGPTLASPCR